MVRRERTGLECVDYIEDWCSKDNLQTPYMQLHTIRKELKLLEMNHLRLFMVEI